MQGTPHWPSNSHYLLIQTQVSGLHLQILSPGIQLPTSETQTIRSDLTPPSFSLPSALEYTKEFFQKLPLLSSHACLTTHAHLLQASGAPTPAHGHSDPVEMFSCPTTEHSSLLIFPGLFMHVNTAHIIGEKYTSTFHTFHLSIPN